jgi:hypothetical protein
MKGVVMNREDNCFSEDRGKIKNQRDPKDFKDLEIIDDVDEDLERSVIEDESKLVSDDNEDEQN